MGVGGLPVVVVASGGLPVTEAANGLGRLITVASNGLGLPVTYVPSGGLPVITDAFTPAALAGLVFAIKSDEGVSTDVNGITSISPAWGTSIGVTGTGTNEPDKATGIGPSGQDLIQVTAANTEFFSMNSNVVLNGDCTLVVVGSVSDISANRVFFGSNPSTTGNIRLNMAANTLGVTVAGGSVVNAAMAANLRPTVNMSVMVFVYQANVNGGTLTSYFDGQANTPVIGVGTAGFTFNRLFVTGASTAPMQGYVYAALAYNRALSASQVSQLTTFFAPARGLTLFAASSGSDSSVTPWRSSTPFQTISKLLGFAIRGDETLALAPGVWRVNSTVSATIAGLSNSTRVTINGDYFNTGTPAQLRGSTAPTLALESGTTYSSAGTYDPLRFVYYIPGGTLNATSLSAFLSSVDGIVRLTKTAGTQTAPGVGEFGYDNVGSKWYFNAGVALTTGNIEVPVQSLAGPIGIAKDNYNIKNIVVAFTEGRCWSNTLSDNIKQSFCHAVAAQTDGNDTDNALTGLEWEDCWSALCGQGPVGTGGSAGDGFSPHDGAVGTMLRCVAYKNDKEQWGVTGGAQITLDRCLGIGPLPFRLTGAGSGGYLIVRNSIGNASSVTGAQVGNAVQNNHASSPVTVQSCTLYGSTGGSSVGINNVSTGALTIKNTIINRFATGVSGTVTEDHNCLFGNTANGITPAVSDVLSDPLFASAGTNFSLQAGTPCRAMGVDISGIASDYAGVGRRSPPSIGAYEAP